MGYTHYWEVDEAISPENWEMIRCDAGKLISAFEHPLRTIALNSEQIVICAPRPVGYETFVLNREPVKFGFCKTGHYLYDKLVCAILCMAAHRDPGISVSSDACMGSQPDGWPPAAAWASRVLKCKIKVPWNYSLRGRLRGIYHRILWRL